MALPQQWMRNEGADQREAEATYKEIAENNPAQFGGQRGDLAQMKKGACARVFTFCVVLSVVGIVLAPGLGDGHRVYRCAFDHAGLGGAGHSARADSAD